MDKNKKNRDGGSKPSKANVEVKDLMQQVKELAAAKSTGMERLHHKSDVLTKLGVPSPKEQTMPFKMKMGIIAGRKKRMERIKAEAKESGYVGAIPFLLQKTATKSSVKEKKGVDIFKNSGQNGVKAMTQKRKLRGSASNKSFKKMRT